MKRSLFSKALKGGVLAVPAAALMLGAAQAGTTIGMNFEAYYYDSGTVPQTIGYGAGYQTTGWPVTATAFGIAATNWYGTASPDLLDAHFVAIDNIYTFGPGGALSAHLVAPGMWQTGIGGLLSGFVPGETVLPGNDEVTWNYLNSTSGESASATISGLATTFPHGYALQTIAANGGVASFNGVSFTDSITTNHADYSTYYVANAAGNNGTVGLSGASGTFTNDTVEIVCDTPTSGNSSVLCGFIISDQPVVTRSVPVGVLRLSGTSVILPPASIVGIGLSYQWQRNGIDLPGATFPSYTNNSVTTADAGLYQVVATSSYFPGLSVTGQVANVSVVPTHAPRTATWDANTATAGAQDGPGTWGYAFTNWWSGSADDYWNPTDSAVFGVGGTGPYTITVADDITANTITFNSDGYTLASASSQTLTLQGTAGITANGNTTIGPALSTTNTFIKSGPGALTLAGALTCPQTFVQAGTLEVLAKNGDSPYVVTNGATLKIGYTTGGTYANTGMQLYGDGTAATTGFYLKGGQSYNCSGQIQLLGAPTTIRQYGTGLASLGTFDINGNGLWCSATASGSIIDTNVQMVSQGYGMSAEIDAGANTATADLTLNGPLNVNAVNYGFFMRGAGSLRLNAVAGANNRGLQIQGGTVICGITNCIGANAILKTSAGGTLDLNGLNETVTNATLAGNLKMSINTGGTPSGTVLRTTDASTPLTYGGTLTVTSSGSAPSIGQKFTLFSSAGGYGGTFAQFVLPPFDHLSWDTSQLPTDGSITVVAGSVPPTITTDLSAGTTYAFVGARFSLSIEASGDPTLHYLWKKNGTTPVGTDSPTLTLTSISTADSGDYSVTVTNPYGSSPASTSHHLTVEAAPSSYPAEVIQDKPLAFWPLNESDPSTAYDYSGAGNDGAQTGVFTLGVAGPQSPAYAGFTTTNTAYMFDGNSSYVDCGTGPALSGSTDFTLEAWINTTSTLVPGMILQQRSPGGYNGEYMFSVNTNGTLSFTIYGGGGYQFAFSSSTSAKLVNDGTWHYVAAVRSGANGTIYIDGSPSGSATGPARPLDPTIPVAIGTDTRAVSSFFNGLMCNVAIYSTALSATAIQAHYTVGHTGALPPNFNPPVLNNGQLTISWTGTGTLWQSTNVALPMNQWTSVTSTSPYIVTPATAGSRFFYRLKQ